MNFETIGNWLNTNQGIVDVLLFMVSLVIAWVTGFIRFLFNLIFKRKKTETKKIIFNQSGGAHSRNVQGEDVTYNE